MSRTAQTLYWLSGLSPSLDKHKFLVVLHRESLPKYSFFLQQLAAQSCKPQLASLHLTALNVFFFHEFVLLLLWTHVTLWHPHPPATKTCTTYIQTMRRTTCFSRGPSLASATLTCWKLQPCKEVCWKPVTLAMLSSTSGWQSPTDPDPVL